MAISLLTIATFSYSNGSIGATISNGTSYSIGFFDNTTNTSNSLSASVLTYSQVEAEPLLFNRLGIDAEYGFEFYIQKYNMPTTTQFRVTYYKWESMFAGFQLYKSILINKVIPTSNNINGYLNSCGTNYNYQPNGCRCGGYGGGCGCGYDLTKY